MSHPTAYTAENTVPLPTDAELREVLGDGYNPDTTLNVAKMFAGTQDLCPAAFGMVQAVFQAEGISPRTREMIVLRAAKVLDSPYEWQANAVMAKNTGLSEREIEAAADDGPVTGIDAEYVLVCRATDELSKTGTLTDATVSELLKHLGVVGARKIILLIAWFNLLSLFLNGCRVPLETTDKIGTGTTPMG